MQTKQHKPVCNTGRKKKKVAIIKSRNGSNRRDFAFILFSYPYFFFYFLIFFAYSRHRRAHLKISQECVKKKWYSTLPDLTLLFFRPCLSFVSSSSRTSLLASFECYPPVGGQSESPRWQQWWMEGWYSRKEKKEVHWIRFGVLLEEPALHIFFFVCRGFFIGTRTCSSQTGYDSRN